MESKVEDIIPRKLKKSFKPIKSLGSLNECYGSIKDIDVSIEGVFLEPYRWT